jgi:hypothetical protein
MNEILCTRSKRNGRNSWKQYPLVQPQFKESQFYVQAVRSDWESQPFEATEGCYFWRLGK